MASHRRRLAPNGGPAPCVVRIPATLSPILFREKRKKGFRDETELVVAIVRAWADANGHGPLTPDEWEGLKKELLPDEPK
jgi:hypothetical protein